MPLEVQSISAAGLAVLTGFCGSLRIDQGAVDAQTGEALTFVLERNGESMMLRANLVWLELSGEPDDTQRLELIVDTTDQPGWWEVQSALALD
ncbi:MAG: hypothetical protein AB7P78_01610 [Candidatus Binatia bacterium]